LVGEGVPIVGLGEEFGDPGIRGGFGMFGFGRFGFGRFGEFDGLLSGFGAIEM
jgi:hypothetical protein